jgi:hypothetical protein
VDASDLEANASLKSIVRRHSGDEELRRFDKKRTDKKVSNADWVNPHDPDARR